MLAVGVYIERYVVPLQRQYNCQTQQQDSDISANTTTTQGCQGFSATLHFPTMFLLTPS